MTAISISPKTLRRTRPFDQVPRVAGPDLTAVPWLSLQTGSRAGFLTVVAPGLSPGDRTVARCDCGVTLTPLTGYIASGRVRSCGDLTAHGWWG